MAVELGPRPLFDLVMLGWGAGLLDDDRNELPPLAPFPRAQRFIGASAFGGWPTVSKSWTGATMGQSRNVGKHTDGHQRGHEQRDAAEIEGHSGPGNQHLRYRTHDD